MLLVATDLDGTLLNKDKRIPTNTAQVLSQLQSQGKQVILATGRHFIDARVIAQRAGLSAHFVASNGAQVYDKHGHRVHETYLASSLVEQIIQCASSFENVNINIYHKDCWFVTRETKWLKKFKHQINIPYRLMNLQSPPTEQVLKVYFTSTGEDLQVLNSLEETLNQEFQGRLNICFSSPQCLEVMASNVSKLTGLQLLADSLGLNVADCIAFGDGMNDIEMLSGVGLGVVMSTASPRVKSLLPHAHEIGTSGEEAVAKFLQSYLSGTALEVSND